LPAFLQIDDELDGLVEFPLRPFALVPYFMAPDASSAHHPVDRETPRRENVPSRRID